MRWRSISFEPDRQMSAMPASKHGNSSSSRSSKAETGSAPGGEGGGQAVDPEENSLEVKGNSDASAPEQCAHENNSADKELISQTKQVSVSPKNTPSNSFCCKVI